MKRRQFVRSIGALSALGAVGTLPLVILGLVLLLRKKRAAI